MEKVLIYDDDVDILDVCTAILQIKGYEVFCKDNCRSLFEDLDTIKPDIIMMDNWLPDMGGVKAIQTIKSNEKFKNIPIIFFSANSSVDELAKEAKADFVLKKPFDISTLEGLLKQGLALNLKNQL